MSGLSIIGSGHYVPGRPYSNQDLSRVLDTNDEWIRQRTGIAQRHFCPEGQGVSDLALHAAQRALEAAGKRPEDIDYILFSTMTPDHIFPGSGSLLAAKLGCPTIPAPDLRTQCAASLYGFQIADALLKAEAAECILIVGAEAHAGLMPWRDWDILEGTSDCRPSPEDWERATRHRGWAIIFGDGAGAVVAERHKTPGKGVIAVDLHSDGRFASQLCIPAGFRTRPYLSAATLDGDASLLHMDGREVFKHAVTKLPKSILAVCQKAEVSVDQVDWFVAHQANARINEAIASRLNVPMEKMPSNIERFGNTSAATIPILMDEMRRDGRIQPNQLICVAALGAGFHWGSLLFANVKSSEHYTFGDTDVAAERLRLLARVFEPSSSRLLGALSNPGGALALDLGCGPGASTRLVAEHVATERVVGLEQSPRHLEQATREQASSRVSFLHCDVSEPPFPLPAASVLYSRFLLTHLRQPAQVIRAWASAAEPNALLVLEETAFMTGEHPAFPRYYALVERMQAHYGQRMYIGRELAAFASCVEWSQKRAEVIVAPLPATDMARLHALNLSTWSNDPFAQANYDRAELDALGAELTGIASGEISAAAVSCGIGQVVLRRAG